MSCAPTDQGSTAASLARLDLARMDQHVHDRFNAGLSSTTVSSYQCGLRQYLAFCLQFSMTPFPLSEVSLCRFVAYIYSQNFSFHSVSLYLSSLCFSQITLSEHDPHLPQLHQLHYVMLGLRRRPPLHSRPRRLPITPSILHLLRYS